MKQLILIIFAFVNYTSAIAQMLSGNILDESYRPIENALVYVMSVNDSTVIAKTKSDTNGKFCLEASMHDGLLLCVTSLEYETLYKEIKQLQCGDIILKRKDIALDNVVVMAKRPLIVSKGPQDEIQVKGSYLEKLGNLGDVLYFTPGIVSKGKDRYEVLGRGVPIFYVDGREMKWQNIYNTIKSSNIKKIIVDREPSAEYPIGTNAVVNIITVKKLEDQISLDLFYNADLKRKFSDNPSFDFRIKKGKYSTSIGYDYSMNRNLNRETYFTEIFRDDDTFRSDEANDNLTKMSSHIVTWNNEIELNANHTISASYYYSHSYDIDNNDEHITYSNYSLGNRDVMRDICNRRNLHNVNLYYTGKTTKRSRLSICLDYVFINNKSQSKSQETTLADGRNLMTSTFNRGNYNIFSINSKYAFYLPCNIVSNIGARYYKTINPLAYSTNNPYYDDGIANYHQRLADDISTCYMKFSREWKNVKIDAGATYEYSYTSMSTQHDDNNTFLSTRSSIFRPNLQVTYTPSKILTFWIVYDRSTRRQGYLGLSPLPVYQDSLSYSIGNQDLKPTVTDRYAVYARWKAFTLSCSFNYARNSIKEVAYCQDMSTNVITHVPVNFATSRDFVTSLSYYKDIGKLMLNSAVYLAVPDCRYEFLGEDCKASKPSVNLNVNITYFPTASLYLFTTFQYQSRNENLNREQKAANNWTVGIQQSLFNDRLSISLKAMDILHKAHYNNITASYINTKGGTYGTNDFRGVSLSLTYSLFRTDISVKSKSANKDIISRTIR